MPDRPDDHSRPQQMREGDHADVDPGRPAHTHPFDHDEGKFGQSYSREREAAMEASDPSGGTRSSVEADGDRGRRASVDPATGAAHGSGAGAGGSPGSHEDHDEDAGGGSAANR